MKKLNKKGFTLIELIVVIAILAILVAILIPSLTNYIDAANKSKNQANCRSLYTEYALKVATTTINTVVTVPTNNTGGTITVTPTGNALVGGSVITEFQCVYTGSGAATFKLTENFK